MNAKESICSYLGYGGKDHLHRTLDQSLAWDDERLESIHDFVQWWFPLAEPSSFNPHAPVATHAEFEALGADEHVRAGVERAMHRMLRFYGLCQQASGAIKKTSEWDRRSPNWAFKTSHNDLRITRILKSLCLLGHRQHAEALLRALEEIIKYERDPSDQGPLIFLARSTDLTI